MIVDWTHKPEQHLFHLSLSLVSHEFILNLFSKPTNKSKIISLQVYGKRERPLSSKQ